MQKCPRCGSGHVHRSHAKSRLEHVRKYFSLVRLHRCHKCGWRGWGAETAFQSTPLGRAAVEPPDLAALDAKTALLNQQPDAAHTDRARLPTARTGSI